MTGRRPPASQGGRAGFLRSWTTFLLLAPLFVGAQVTLPNVPRENNAADTNLSPPDVRETPPLNLKLEPTDHEFNKPRKYVKDTLVDTDTRRAIATLSPADNAVDEAAITKKPSRNAGLGSLSKVRSLQDWEVEDLVLLATVDGSIYARDRKTGGARWALQSDKAMVETTYHPSLKKPGLDKHQATEDLLWIIEPSRDGDLYVYNSAQGGGLQPLHITVRKLVEELTPYAGEDPAVVYTAEKNTTLYRIDAGTGTITGVYGPRYSQAQDEQSCRRVDGLSEADTLECGTMGSIMIGRTEYRIAIQHKDATPICTLTYSEWTPNSRDLDLQSQYSSTKDQNYVYSRHDGSIFGFDHGSRGREQRFVQKLPSPVVRVFDVARPSDAESRDTELVLLAQPQSRQAAEELMKRQERRVFVNQTESGGWYAMSEVKYPLVIGGAPAAKIYDLSRLDFGSGEYDPFVSPKEDLIGVHSLSSSSFVSDRERGFLTISGPSQVPAIGDKPADYDDPSLSDSPLKALRKQSYLIDQATTNALDIFIVVFFVFIAALVAINRKIIKTGLQKLEFPLSSANDLVDIPATTPATPIQTEFDAEIKARDIAVDTISTPAEDVTVGGGEKSAETVVIQEPVKPELEGVKPETLIKEVETKPGSKVRIAETIQEEEEDGEKVDEVQGVPIKLKKPARRGKRGGHKKKNTSPGDSEAVDEAVKTAMQVNSTAENSVTAIEKSIPGEVENVSGPIIKVGRLEVYTDQIKGYGSHGTVVYAGKFDGRDVAVKRMLYDFYDIASHEIGLLQQSDDHPNVVRYYDKETSGQFLYIALELCLASLQDIIDKPDAYAKDIGGLALDLPEVLRQITLGVQYLHSLKIVHRDIKPQNILVSKPRAFPAKPGYIPPPRFLISDFGLCKKLEDDQSSWRATTAQAAGTSGWRAPELLDKGGNKTSNGLSASSMGTSVGSETLYIDPRTKRRVTRAIDIFALGCVFYYVLTGGRHPFDRDGPYMLEANIEKGNFDLEELRKLGDYQWEARDLVGSMIALDPHDRPDAAKVLAHPFFFNAQERLDFLCQVSDQFEFEPRDPPSEALQILESYSKDVLKESKMNFLSELPKEFIATMAKQRKYTGDRLLDLLRAMRNKKNHYEDMPDNVKRMVGPLPEGYLTFWTGKFPNLLMACHEVIIRCGWTERDRFRNYYARG